MPDSREVRALQALADLIAALPSIESAAVRFGTATPASPGVHVSVHLAQSDPRPHANSRTRSMLDVDIVVRGAIDPRAEDHDPNETGQQSAFQVYNARVTDIRRMLASDSKLGDPTLVVLSTEGVTQYGHTPENVSQAVMRLQIQVDHHRRDPTLSTEEYPQP